MLLRFLAFVAGLVLLSGCSVVGIRSGYEQPADTVLERIGETVEVRRYCSRLAAEATVKAGDAETGRKEELAAYWAKVWERALAHLGRRPLKLVRHVSGTTFYHKGKLPPVPEGVHKLTIEKRDGGEGTRLWVDDLAGLVGLVESGAVELHPWNARVDDIEHPNMLVFDLDPGEGVAWKFVIDTALMLRRMLKGEGLEPWPKLTGGKGLHLMTPLKPKIDHDQARAYAKQIARRLAATAPDRYTLSSDPGQRTGRIFIDYLRNGRGTTAISAWSPRARAGFPIAAPVSGRKVENGIRPGRLYDGQAAAQIAHVRWPASLRQPGRSSPAREP